MDLAELLAGKEYNDPKFFKLLFKNKSKYIFFQKLIIFLQKRH